MAPGDFSPAFTVGAPDGQRALFLYVYLRALDGGLHTLTLTVLAPDGSTVAAQERPVSGDGDGDYLNFLPVLLERVSAGRYRASLDLGGVRLGEWALQVVRP